jgi:hypothetical protein
MHWPLFFCAGMETTPQCCGNTARIAQFTRQSLPVFAYGN